MLYVWLSPIIVFLTFSATRFVPALAAALLALMLSAVVVIGARPVAVTPLASIEMFIAGAWIAAASIMTSSLLTVLSPVRFAMGQAISAASDRDAARVFRSLLPFALMIIGISVLATLCAEVLLFEMRDNHS